MYGGLDVWMNQIGWAQNKAMNLIGWAQNNFYKKDLLASHRFNVPLKLYPTTTKQPWYKFPGQHFSRAAHGAGN